MQSLQNSEMYSLFLGKYEITDKIKENIETNKNIIDSYLKKHLHDWISDQRCNSIEDITSFGKKMEKFEKMLKDCDYVQEARLIVIQKERELQNTEKIRERQMLTNDCTEYLNDNNISIHIGYTKIKALESIGLKLLERIEEYADFIGKDASKFKMRICIRINELREFCSQIENEMNSVYDKLDTLGSINDIKILLK